MAEDPTLSIIIVNWKSVDFTRKCLKSVYTHARDMSVEILVIDNASFDGCSEMIPIEFPAVRFIQSQENLGFACANNVAFEHSKGEILLFLNPDTEIVGTALQDMMTCVASRQDVGVVGPKLLNSDLSVQTSCLQSFPSILNQVLDSEFLRARFPKSFLWGNSVLFESEHGPVVEAQGISGACMMIRRSVFEQVARFSQEYFMYAEDMDLCYKVHEAGWRNYFVAGAIVIHHGGQSSGAQSYNQFSTLVMRESLLTYFRVHRGDFYAHLFQLATAVAALGRLGVLAVIKTLPVVSPQRSANSLAFVKWSSVFRWAIGMESATDLLPKKWNSKPIKVCKPGHCDPNPEK